MKYEVLNDIINIFKNNNIEIFADYGTLLGCIRNSGFIKTDKDLDFSITLENNFKKYLKNIFKDLKSRKFRLLLSQKGDTFSVANIDRVLKNGRFVIYRKDIKPIDIFFWVRNEDKNWERIKYLLEDEKYNKGKLLKDEWISEIVYKDFENVKIPCPIKYEELLEHRYGDWKTEVNYYSKSK